MLKAILALGFAAGSFFASPIIGDLNFTGNASITAGGIAFKCDLGTVCAPGYGDFFATGGTAQTGTFAPLAASFGQVLTVTPATAPINTPFDLADFITFDTNPDIVFDLTFVFEGNGTGCPPAAPLTCTPDFATLVTAANPTGKAASTWSATPTGSTAAISVLAHARRVSTGEETAYRGVITAQFGAPAATVIAALASGGTVSTSYSATFVPVAESHSWVLCCMGATLLSLVRARRHFESEDDD